MFIRNLIKAGAATVLCAFSLTAFSAPIEIKFSHVVAENTPKGQMAIHFKELVEKRFPGRVSVQVFPNAQLFGDNKVLEALLLGDVQLAAPSVSKFQKFTDQLQVFDLPFLFEDMEAVDRFQQSPAGQKILGSLGKKGLVGLGYLHNGMKQLSANSPIREPRDAEGKKFRIMTSDVLAAQFETVDAIPVKKPFSEVFTLLQTKAIDGQENSWSNIYSKKFFEVQPYITETNHGVLDYLVVTSAEFWQGLPDDLRPEIKKALEESIAYGNKIADLKDQEDKEAIIASGQTKVLPLTAGQREQWVESMRPVWKQFEKQIGRDLIAAAVASNQ
ncbi:MULTISPECIES: TRAP transporter substrate-binding protein [unclassified Microbulbifer]|uniref:TRAP transporter substrate-binding protein n=1 Tax=unclassified Microbulbifer TaxID=2619833 RepID=UPI0027E49486|nr:MULTISPECIES: TRAP transporter substrate-binding protein [unclassified Microbulbifer]